MVGDERHQDEDIQNEEDGKRKSKSFLRKSSGRWTKLLYIILTISCGDDPYILRCQSQQ